MYYVAIVASVNTLTLCVLPPRSIARRLVPTPQSFFARLSLMPGPAEGGERLMGKMCPQDQHIHQMRANSRPWDCSFLYLT